MDTSGLIEPYLTLQEASKILNLSEKSLRRFAKEGLPHLRLPGGRYRFKYSDVELWFRERAERNERE
jgi:DNA binding domain, excisionase family